MAETITCGSCGVALAETANRLADDLQLCPKCGSTSRRFSVEATISLAFPVSATAAVITYPEALLSIARGLIEQAHFNIAIVTSHMACEVATERAFDAAYARRELQWLGDAVDGLMNGYNLGNDRHRKLFNALTGSRLESLPFWSGFKNASDMRNAIIHKGGQSSKAEAELALQAATELIHHLKEM